MRKSIVSALWITCAFLLASCGGGSGNLLGPGGAVVEVALVEPASTTAVRTDTRIIVSFDVPMDASSIDNSTFQLLQGAAAVPAESVSYDALARRATLIPRAATAGLPALNPSTAYTVRLTTAVRTSEGKNLSEAQSISITTEAAPAVSGISPANGATLVPVTDNVRVTFTKPVTGVTDNTFFLETGGVRVPAPAPVANLGNTVFTLVPSLSLAYGTTYTVTVTNGVKDVTGNPLASTSTTTFTTVAFPVPLVPMAFVPDNNATNVWVTTAVTVAFNQPVSGANRFLLTRVSPVGNEVSGTVTFAGNVVIFTPDDQLSPQSRYEAVILGGVTGLQDNLAWRFTTAAADQRIDLREAAAGGSHGIALGNDGSLWSWGANAYGQLGDGTTNARDNAARVPGGYTARQVAAGESHSLALLDDGTVIAWGGNAFGQLGNGTVTDSPTPVPVSGLGNVVQISTQKNHNLARLGDGTVRAWGANAFGQLGDNTATAAGLAPVQVLTSDGTPLSNVVSVSAGGSLSLALDSNGTVWQWGRNGIGSSDVSPVAFRVEGLTNLGTGGVADPGIAAGDLHCVAVDNSGRVYTWGSNQYGQLGNGTTGGFETTPKQVVQSLGNIGGILAGPNQTFAGQQSTIYGFAWGKNDVGQLCDGTTTQRNLPVRMLDFDGSPLFAVGGPSSGRLNTYFVKNVSRLYGCGGNSSGQLGTGVGATELPQSALPVQVYFSNP